MGEKLLVGPFKKGLRNDVTPFNVDNDSFPVLINAYQWRGRIKRKRGTAFFCRLQRFFNSTSVSYNTGSPTITLDGSGNGNLITGFGLQPNATIIPGSVSITDTVSSVTYTDPAKNGTLSPSGTINYSSGAIQIAAAAGHTITAHFIYYPDLPVMGLRDFFASSTQFPAIIGFDPKYSYNILTTIPTAVYDVSFYKNPLTASFPGYIQKTNETPVSWNGADYQQFWTINYQGALWATNGIDYPFTGSTIGMQFKPIVAVTVTSGGPPAIVNLQITGHGLVVGDFLFINEVLTTTGINLQTGYVIAVVDANNVTVEFPDATIATNGTGGIAQYLTNRSNPAKDCIRWYDGDPTNGSATNPILNGTRGWINFQPPLSNLPFSIADKPAAQYYLVGARVIATFKDRILFFGPVIQASTGPPIYLLDTVIYSQNGTPYYTSSFTGDPTFANTVYTPILVPVNQTAAPNAYFEDVTGFGGNITAGVDQDISTVAPNEDALIVGFTRLEARLLYTGNDIVPFNFYIINSELGSTSTFSAITMDKGIFSVGGRGFIITSQVESQRIDLDIPDEIFEVSLFNNGSQRVCSQRDYINEWIYFTYPSSTITYVYPNQTLQYNYRDNSWGLFYENYTTYGTVRQSTQFTWATVGDFYPTWSDWNEPWNAGATNSLQPKVIGGNQQGFVLMRDMGTTEPSSLYIQNISFPVAITGATQAVSAVLTAVNQFVAGQNITITGVVGMTQLNNNTYSIISATPTTITISVNSTGFSPYISGGTATPSATFYVPNHCLNDGDYIQINGCLGTSSVINGQIFSVNPVDKNNFNVFPPIPTGLTYLGGGLIVRMYVPFIQTKQFPTGWSMERKTRLGQQQYLFTRTPNGQLTLNIYLSQDADDAFNMGPIVPTDGPPNNTLIYSTILFTSAELYIQNCPNIPLGNVGNGSSLTYNFDLFTLFNIQFAELIPGKAFIQVGNVATFTDNGTGGFTATGTGTSIGSSINYFSGMITLAFTVAPTSHPTIITFQYSVNNIQSPTADSQSQIWHRLNTSLLGDTVQIGFTLSDSQMRDITFANQFAEVELHGFILDCSASSLLA
jgi:hypothetical protein